MTTYTMAAGHFIIKAYGFRLDESSTESNRVYARGLETVYLKRVSAEGWEIVGLALKKPEVTTMQQVVEMIPQPSIGAKWKALEACYLGEGCVAFFLHGKRVTTKEANEYMVGEE